MSSRRGGGAGSVDEASAGKLQFGFHRPPDYQYCQKKGPARAPAKGDSGQRKVTTWEGGVRDPFIAWWPGRVPAGTVTPAFSTVMDLFPTCVKLAGLEMPQDR
jgi:arylsulfatase A-like enzyme